MPTARIDDAEVHYEVSGQDGPPVLLIMGLAVPGSLWRPQVEALSPAHRVATFDNRGAGRTRARPGLYTMGRLAADALALMDHLGWPEAHVAGVSMGGMIAQHVALAAPRRVRSLTLIATHAGGLRSLLPHHRGLALFAQAQLVGRKRRLKVLSELLYPPEHLANVDRGEFMRRFAADLGPPPRLSGRLSQLAAIARHRTSPRLRSLADVPTLVVQPGRDILIRPSECARLHAAIPNARLAALHDAGHGVTGQCAEEVSALLADHIAQAEARRAQSQGASAAAPGSTGGA